MNNSQSAVIIKTACKNKDIPISKLLEDCSIRKSLMYDMEKRNYTPSAEVLEKIANYLDCSVDYLLGRDNGNQISTGSISNNGNIGSIDNSISIENIEKHELSEYEMELLRIYNVLDIKMKMELMQFAYDLENKKEK